MKRQIEAISDAFAIIRDARNLHEAWATWQERTPGWKSEIKPEDPGEPAHHREWIARYDKVIAALHAAHETASRINEARGEYDRDATVRAVGELREVAANLRRGKNKRTADRLDHVLDLALACSIE